MYGCVYNTVKRGVFLARAKGERAETQLKPDALPASPAAAAAAAHSAATATNHSKQTTDRPNQYGERHQIRSNCGFVHPIKKSRVLFLLPSLPPSLSVGPLRRRRRLRRRRPLMQRFAFMARVSHPSSRGRIRGDGRRPGRGTVPARPFIDTWAG